MKINLNDIGTEQRNLNTLNIDTLSTLEMVQLINREDQRIIESIDEAAVEIAQAIDLTYKAIEEGGRLVYIGAGTSGRLGVLDASEILPTFGVGEESVIGLIAGGDLALRLPIESAEDSESLVIEDLKNIDFNSKDVLCAIAASGRTPYCIGGLKYAQEIGAKTISLACVSNSEIGKIADVAIEAVVGQEVITGSTRMKSGSATKMVLNMITTGAMIKLGKVYGNLMVDVKTSNLKLIERAKNIIMDGSGCDYETASKYLDLTNNDVKLAIVMLKTSFEINDAKELLSKFKGHVTKALDSLK